MAATLTKPKVAKRRPVLREQAVRSPGVLAVDRDAGVIRGVKVLGLHSQNGRTYTTACLRSAAALYEGVRVNVDHPQRGERTRAADDRFGRLVNVRLEEDGLYADLEYLRSHPMAERICEAAERMPGAYGLSHNVPGEQYETDARDPNTITRIHKVESVDLVADPATTGGLFEGVAVTKSVREILAARKPKLTEARQKWLARLLEMDDLDAPMDAPVDMPAGDVGAGADDPDAALWGGFQAAVTAILDKYKAGELDAAAAVKQVAEYLKTHEKLTAAPEPEAPADEPVAEADGEDDEADDKDAKESVELAALRRKDAARDLCESLQFVPTKDQLAALCEIATDKTRRATAEAFKAAAAPKIDPTRPRSRAAGGLTEARESYDDDSYGRATRAAGVKA